MVEVTKHGPLREVVNPANGQVTREIPVTFTETGRGGLNESLSETNSLLSEFAGVNVGLDQFRTHTFAVKEAHIGKFPIGQKLPFFINRKLFSNPQMRQQVDVNARMIDGKGTYVTTYLSRQPEADRDYRMSVDTQAQTAPGLLLNARPGQAEVRTVDVGTATENVVPEAVQHETLTQQ